MEEKSGFPVETLPDQMGWDWLQIIYKDTDFANLKSTNFWKNRFESPEPEKRPDSVESRDSTVSTISSESEDNDPATKDPNPIMTSSKFSRNSVKDLISAFEGRRTAWDKNSDRSSDDLDETESDKGGGGGGGDVPQKDDSEDSEDSDDSEDSSVDSMKMDEDSDDETLAERLQNLKDWRESMRRKGADFVEIVVKFGKKGEEEDPGKGDSDDFQDPKNPENPEKRDPGSFQNGQNRQNPEKRDSEDFKDPESAQNPPGSQNPPKTDSEDFKDPGSIQNTQNPQKEDPGSFHNRQNPENRPKEDSEEPKDPQIQDSEDFQNPEDPSNPQTLQIQDPQDSMNPEEPKDQQIQDPESSQYPQNPHDPTMAQAPPQTEEEDLLLAEFHKRLQKNILRVSGNSSEFKDDSEDLESPEDTMTKRIHEIIEKNHRDSTLRVEKMETDELHLRIREKMFKKVEPKNPGYDPVMTYDDIWNYPDFYHGFYPRGMGFQVDHDYHEINESPMDTMESEATYSMNWSEATPTTVID